jgi:hypothetical protein
LIGIFLDLGAYVRGIVITCCCRSIFAAAGGIFDEEGRVAFLFEKWNELFEEDARTEATRNADKHCV